MYWAPFRLDCNREGNSVKRHTQFATGQYNRLLWGGQIMLTSRLKSTNKDMTVGLFDCPIAFIGKPAFDLLPRCGLPETVIASFSRSCWLETPGGHLFAIADHQSGEGPLTVGVALPGGVTLAELGVEQGTKLVPDGVDFRLGDHLILRTAATVLWRPAPLGPRVSNDEVARRLWALIDSVAVDAPIEGLAPLMGYLGPLAYGNMPGAADVGIVPRFAMPNVALLAEGVVHDDCDAVDRAVHGLTGLGPGLTPSGDDMLGGLMVALRTASGTIYCNEAMAQGFSQSSNVSIIDELSRSIVRHSTQTNRISAALLEQAALGIGSAAQQRVAQCLHELTPATGLEAAVAELVRWGHTSGWDSLTGVLFGTGLALRLTETFGATAGNGPMAGAGA